MFSKSVAVELGPRGVLVNTIAPGWIQTDMLTRFHGSPVEEDVLRRTPTRTFGSARDIAGIAVYLASEAGRFTTGATITVDGGYSQA